MREVEFKHESMQDQSSIATYLEAIIKGVAEGSLVLADKNREVVLEPQGLLKFDVEARRQDERCELILTVSWTERGAVDAEGDILTIKAG